MFHYILEKACKIVLFRHLCFYARAKGGRYPSNWEDRSPKTLMAENFKRKRKQRKDKLNVKTGNELKYGKRHDDGKYPKDVLKMGNDLK